MMAYLADAGSAGRLAHAALALVLVLHAPEFGRPAGAATEVQQVEPTGRAALLAIAADVVRAAPQLATIWPGYWPPNQAFIIYSPSEGALLISPGERPASFQPLQPADLPDELKGRAFWHSGSLSDVRQPFMIGYPIGSGKTAILVNAADTNAERIITLLLHEQFHGYQEGRFKRLMRQFVDPLAIKDRVAFAVAAETERRVLAKALLAQTAKERSRLLRQYLALRREREAAMPVEVVKVEQGFELWEGTAKYVDRAGHAVIAGGLDRLTPLLVAELQKPLASKTGAFATQWFRTRGYGTGAAITYLISRLDQGNWRAKLEGGAAPDEILESLVGNPGPAALAKQARALVDQQAVRRELEPVIRAAEKAEIKSVAEFLAGAAYQVVLDAKAAGKGSTGFNAGTMAQLGQSTIALPKASMFNYSAPAVSMSARDLPVLIEGMRFTVLTASAPKIVGLGEPALGEHRLSSAVIQGSGVELRIERPVVVTVTETSMAVRVAE